MENRLKAIYGRRITVNGKILILVFVTLMGLHLALSKTNESEKATVEQVMAE
jgi:hypothetical protein